MQQARTKTKIQLSAILMVVVFALALSSSESAQAAPFDQQPVPTYGPVTSIGENTTATIPANLVTEWRGLYTRPAGSVIGRTEKISGATLKQYLQSVVFNKSTKQPTVTYKFNPAAVYVWTGQIANSVNVPASEPSMEIEDGRVKEFTPPQTGKVLDRYASTLKIMDSLSQGITILSLKVNTTEPTESLGELNNLGITELIGRGESKFNGSPFNRRHNIKIGVKKMTGVIIKPGEEFSFNKYLGPVEAYAGFKPELVIKATGTVPELGGGLCQVSSTTFRAAMHAGLPITQRRNHSYAVQYYAPQGTDATIYPGVIDLKFTNDTGNSILIWPYLKDENHLVFDLYGTYDGRKVELGTPYAYDKQSSGAMKATWKRTVTRVGEDPKYDTFGSTYQSPALFHKRESFVPAAPAPGTNPATDPVPTDTTPDTTPPTNTNSNSNSAQEPEPNN